MKLAQYGAGPLLVALCAACLTTQVLTRPAIGMANNNDFQKMAEALGLGPEDGDWDSHKQYGEFIYRYIRADRYVWNNDFRTAEFLSSEYLLLKGARASQRILHPGPRFDIRWAGAINTAFFLAAIGVLIYAIPWRWRLYAGIPLVLVSTDAAYVHYMNSFYMDTAAIIFLLLAVGACLHAARHPANWRWALVTILSVAMFAGSKAQHAPAGLLFIPLLLALALRSRNLARRVWMGGCVLVPAVAVIVLAHTTPQFRAIWLYNQVFEHIAPMSPDSLAALKEVGLGREELALVGTYAYMPSVPAVNDQQWVRHFLARCNFGKIARYYLRHPLITAHVLDVSLSNPAPDVYADLSPDDGFPLDSRSDRFTWWSDVHAWLFRHVWWYAFLLAPLVLAGAIWLLFKLPAERVFAGLLLTVLAVAGLELAGGILVDTLEQNRHLTIYNETLDLLILLFPVLTSKIYLDHRAGLMACEASVPKSSGLLDRLQSAPARRVALLLFAVAYGIFFFRMTRHGLRSWFTEDDLMNTYYCWSRPVSELLRANLEFFSSWYRPMGEAVYWIIFYAFGLDPLGHNIFRMALSFANLFVLYFFVSRLTQSREAGVYAVMLAGFHPNMAHLQFDSGMYYDALAYLFYYGAFIVYLRFRNRDLLPGPISFATILMLYTAALNSKEIAVTFPLALMLYELTIKCPPPHADFRSLLRQFRLPLVAGAMAVLYTIGKNTGSEALSHDGGYALTISPGYYLNTYSNYAYQISYVELAQIRPVLPWLLAGCVGVGFALRSRVLLWASLFNMVAILPIAFITPRAAFAFAVPLVGWAVYASVLLTRFRSWVTQNSEILRAPSLAALVTAIGFFVLRPEAQIMQLYVLPAFQREDVANREYYKQIRSLLPEPRVLSGKRILVLHEPFKLPWTTLFLVQLGYRDPTITVDAATTFAESIRKVVPEDYDFVLNYANGKFFRPPSSPSQAVKPHGECIPGESIPPGQNDDADARIGWSGPWNTSAIFPATSRQTVTFSNSPDAEFCVNFTGTGFDYIYSKAYNRGMAEIRIDGERTAVVDLYSPKVEWQSRTSIQGLAPGRHTLRVRVLHKKSLAASDYYIDLDSIVVR